MIALRLLLLTAALVCFVLAAFNVSVKGVSIGWAGLALWMLANLLVGSLMMLQ